jgi:hypothetical protein
MQLNPEHLREGKANSTAEADKAGAVPVRELRQLARHSGLPRQLSRSGRRADLLAALEVAACS